MSAVITCFIFTVRSSTFNSIDMKMNDDYVFITIAVSWLSSKVMKHVSIDDPNLAGIKLIPI